MGLIGDIAKAGEKYLLRQTKDIGRFGLKEVERSGVTDKILTDITPFRRLSKKLTTLSDPDYFIAKFEKEVGKSILPENWNSISKEAKVDYIVKDRYSKLVSHKIMGKIKDEHVEHLYCLNPDGDIAHYSVGNTTHCSDTGIKGGTSIHNHPGYMYAFYDEKELAYLKKHHPEMIKGMTPHSDGDLYSPIRANEKSAYVVDSQGHKFLFQPGDMAKGSQKEQLIKYLGLQTDLNFLENESFKEATEEEIKNVNTLLAKAQKANDKVGKWNFLAKLRAKKTFQDFVVAKAKLYPMEPYNHIVEEFKRLAKEYNFNYEQLP